MHARVASRRPGLRPPDQPLDGLQLRDVDRTGRLAFEEGPNPLGDVAGGPLTRRDDRAHTEGPAKLLHEVDVAIRRLVPDGDVAARLVGNVHFVPLLAEADEGAPHADHVVIGMRAEDHDPLGKLGRPGRVLAPGHPQPAGLARPAGRPARDRVLHRPKDLDVEIVGAAPVREQILKAVFVVVLVDQFEDRLVELEGQPDHGLADQRVGPLQPQRLQRPHEPGRLEPRELRRGRPVEHELRVGVLLQRAGRDVDAGLLLHRLADDLRLVLAEGQQDHAAGVHDRAHAHRDRLPGHVPLPEEVARRVGPGHAVERDQAGAAVEGAARLVEADVARPTDAEDLQVDAAGRTDPLLIPAAGGQDVAPGEGAVGYVDRVGRDVDVVEEVLPHEAVIALEGVGSDRPIFVEIEGDDGLEGDPILLVEPDEFVVDAHRRAARRQAEHGLLAGGRPARHEVGDLASHRPAGVARLLVDGHGHPLDRGHVGQRPAVDRRRGLDG